MTATWRTYRQVVNGLDVIGTDVIERVDRDGSVHEVHRNLARPIVGPRRMIVAADAVAKIPGLIRSQTMVALNVAGEARPVWRVVAEERPLEPVATYVDVSTGEVLRREPLYWNAKARVFDPNPVAKLNDPTLSDQNNSAAAVPPAAYSDVDLDNLAPSGMLTGPNVTIVDTEAPFTSPHADASQPLIFDRSQPQFEEVNAYFHLDRAQKYLQSLGYSGPRRIVAYSIPVDPHAANGADDSYYISNATGDGTGELYFGDGGTDDAEDSDILLHEYGHAIQDWIAPGAFSGTSSSQARALGEGFGDYWSFSSGYDSSVASGRDPYCIADWDARCAGDDPSQNCGYDAGANCLRRVDSTKTMANYSFSDADGTEHTNGEIWSSALREIFMSAGRRATDTIALESTFGVPPNPTFAALAERMLNADRALYGGTHADAICKAMTARLILTTSDCSLMPRGDQTVVQSPAHGVDIGGDTIGFGSSLVLSDNRPIAKVLVHVDIEDQVRGELRISIVAPDGTSVRLQNPSLDVVPDVHATYGLDAQPVGSLDVFNGKSEAGLWSLNVARLGSHPARLISWELRIKFAGDQPLAVRPFSFADRLHVPAVAHIAGAAGSQWRSDVVLFNRGASAANVTMLFTPSGANGATDFGAVKNVIQPQQVVTYRDVVAQLFNTTGSGTVEIQGDVAQLLAWSSTYDVSDGGTLGQTVDVAHSADAIGAHDPPLDLVPALAPNGGRVNIGIVETAGESGTVRISAGALQQDVVVQPFTHVQVAFSGAPFAQVRVVDGDARVIAYASVIDGATDDPMFVPAAQSTGTVLILPVAASTSGANATRWTTDIWTGSVTSLPVRATFYQGSAATSVNLSDGHYADAVATVFGSSGSGSMRLEVPAGDMATARIATNGRGDRIDAVSDLQAIGLGGGSDAIRIENDDAFRTNIGVTEVGIGPARVRFTLFDSAGKVIAVTERDLAPHQQLQLSLAAFAPPVLDGRVHFEVISGTGHVLGYASVVDNISNDASFVLAQ